MAKMPFAAFSSWVTAELMCPSCGGATHGEATGSLFIDAHDVRIRDGEWPTVTCVDCGKKSRIPKRVIDAIS